MPEAFLLTYLLFENSIWKSVIKLNLQIKLYKQSWIWDNMMSLKKKPVGKREFCSNQNGKYAYFKDKTKQEHFETFFSPWKQNIWWADFFCLRTSQCFKLGWVHQMPPSMVVACEAPLALWREDGELGLVQFWRGSGFGGWWRRTQTFHSGAWWENEIAGKTW